ncbi:3-oxoacyl-[acyl-carrier protein] reductase [Thermodesulforhabdus norvegica]|uniref:3-oxoacyl-[acyl-carrier protein] reductase n=2 Tax=Thermodesulforhabdus norvegica TaxID=39841 RepID=A0A1I4VXT3_9BACT|nr:3-oxoacyl-[acyl-carrier protein] reductase [Thermodesulforhabdus norvegica]
MCELEKGRVALITGGARGLGAAIAQALYEAGAVVAILDLDGDEAARRAGMIDPSGEGTMSFQADVTREDQVLEVVEKIVSRRGRIDILVNCAGVLRHKPIEEKSVEEFEWVIRVNLTGTFIACKAVIPHMKKRNYGRIVSISSLGGRTGRPGVAVDYAAAKAGIVGFTRSLAREVGEYGITVNAVAPGPIMTELTRQVPPEVFARWNVGRAVNRDGYPEDVAKAVLFLASDGAGWITGVTLDINGGIYMR